MNCRNMAIQYEVRHAIPGRIRLHVPAIREIDGIEKSCHSLLRAHTGIKQVRINRESASVIISYDLSNKTLSENLRNALRSVTIPMLLSLASRQDDSENTAGTEELASNADITAAWRPLALPTASLALSLAGMPALSLPLIVYNAMPILKRAFTVLRNEGRLNVDFLDSVAISISTLQGNLFTSAFMNWLISLGDAIRDQTAAKSNRAIADLLDYRNRTAWILRGRKKIEVKVSEIKVGATVAVYDGEMIPVDGKVIRGRATVDQSSITGESLPAKKNIGDKVYAATLVREGKVYVRAERVGSQTTVAQIVKMVEGVPAGETRIQNYAEKFADKLVTPSLAFAGGVWALTRNVDRLLSMLIVDYGTGIRVAAPTCVLASMRYAAGKGIVIRGGSHMEKMNEVDTIVFDKTGTLTQGRPQITDVRSYDERHFPPQKVLALAAAAEARLKHPVAQAIVAKASESRLRIPERQESRYHIGLGVEVQVNGYYLHVGSQRFLERQGVKLDGATRSIEEMSARGHSSLLLAIDGELKGAISYADIVRPESRLVLKVLHNRGIRNLVMLTGDKDVAARAVAEQLGLDQFYSQVLPREKAQIVQELQRSGKVVAMVGDGINDSPALAHADIGIAMKNGADIARQSADIVLMEENLWKLITAFDISRDAVKLIRQNLAIIAGFNTLALALSLPAGLVSPGVTALLSNGSAILASLNSVRPLLRNKPGTQRTPNFSALQQRSKQEGVSPDLTIRGSLEESSRSLSLAV